MKNVMWLALAAFFASLAWTVLTIGKHVNAQIDGMPNVIGIEMDKTRSTLSAEMALLRKDATSQIAKTRVLLDRRISLIETDLNTQVDATRDRLFSTADDITARLDTRTAEMVETLNSTSGSLTGDTHAVVERWLQREPLVYSRFLAVSGESMRTLDSVRRMADEAEKATPHFIADFKDISASAVQTSSNIAYMTRKRSIAERFLVPLGAGVAKGATESFLLH